MAMQENRPNIVVDENFLMLEKRLKRRYAERASAYSNADAIEQERNSARAYAIAPEAYGDSKIVGGMSMYNSGSQGGVKYMTTDDYVSYFARCHDTFGAMNTSNIAPIQKKTEVAPLVSVNTKKIEQIKKLNAKAAATSARKKRVAPVKNTKAEQVSGVARPNPVNVAEEKQKVNIEGSKLDAFFAKLSSVRGRAIASVAAVAICCTATLGGVMAFGSSDNDSVSASPAMEKIRVVEPVEQSDEDARTNLLSTLE
jgi:hypothetical protein